jgi:hypothetical protein
VEIGKPVKPRRGRAIRRPLVVVFDQLLTQPTAKRLPNYSAIRQTRQGLRLRNLREIGKWPTSGVERSFFELLGSPCCAATPMPVSWAEGSMLFAVYGDVGPGLAFFLLLSVATIGLARVLIPAASKARLLRYPHFRRCSS